MKHELDWMECRHCGHQNNAEKFKKTPYLGMERQCPECLRLTELNQLWIDSGVLAVSEDTE